eukprot:CAMPEP_0176029946 /NCGR_PEP_ID=MMETSP0120_2-20121206/14723_1 /TAXON_ID=160619 /ORGANISM="Kryptoperidinium foliaceum, Strain CCMP 1326" /LENGTH=336 /DNA_ID=CAMNT_0017363179 /DNA_START=147 /DNA_END=1154 /DNA_ORIENTATION=+
MTSFPPEVTKILDSLNPAERDVLVKYIQSLSGETPAPAEGGSSSSGGSGGVEHPKYDTASGKEDFDAAADFKQQATEAKEQGDYAKALELYNQAVVAAPPSALLYANRGMCLEKLGHFEAAAQDCTYALEVNPDSVKALKVRGKIRYNHLKDWHGALSDLSQAQSIDFDPDLVAMLKELTELRKQEELEQAKERQEKEEKLKRKAEEIKKAKEEQERQEQARSAPGGTGGGMPGGGFTGGMPGGMPGGMDPSMMAGLMSDPEIQEAMKNPKVVKAFQDLMNGPGGPMGLMSNPAKLQQLMTDPEVGPVLQKLMGKFMGGGGMGGMPGMGGSPFGGG